MKVRKPIPHPVRHLILPPLLLLVTLSVTGCWDDFAWPPGRDDSSPTVDAGADRVVHEGDHVALVADASDDGEIMRYTWEQTGGRAISSTAWDGDPLYDGDNPGFTLDVPWLLEGKEGQVELSVTVTDDEGNTAVDRVTLTIGQRRFAVFEGMDSSHQGEDGEPLQALYRVNLDGTEQQILYAYPQSSRLAGYKISPTGQYVAFNIVQNDDFNLYIAATDGSVTRLIDKGGYLDQNWQWSPWGTRIAYLASHTCDCASEMELHVITTYSAITSGGGTKVTDVVSAGKTVDALQWSPDNAEIAWSVLDPDTNGRELFIASAEGTGTTSVSTGVATSGIDGSSFQWSPYCGEIELSPFGSDTCPGNEIAYIADQNGNGQYELFFADAKGESSTRVSGDLIPEGDVATFQWAAGGRRLAYIANRRYAGVPELFVTDREGSIDHLITRGGSGSTRGGRVDGFQWSPNGKRIGYRISQGMAPGTRYELRTALWDGSDDNNVTVNLPSYSSVWEFGWSPDGSYIAYTADIISPNVRDLYLSTPTGSNKNLISGFTDNNESSVSRFIWSPDGSHVALLVDAQLMGYNELFTVTPDGSVNPISSPDLPMPPDQGEVGDDFKWVPDGSQLVYRSRQGHFPGNGKLLISADEGGGSQVLAGEPITIAGFELR